MPATRRSTSGARSSQGKQSTLSFNNRVTKSVSKPKTLGSPPSKQSPLKHVVAATEDEPDAKDDVSAREPDVVEEEAHAVEAEPVPSEAEARAAKISDRQIDLYWHKVEAERKARRVHQEDLSVAEKVLRYFDVSSQYGVSVPCLGFCAVPYPNPSDEDGGETDTLQPCVGISRADRWRRADRLGLDPPTEVLAVLMKERQKGSRRLEVAHMDEILNSTAVGAS